jgi:hypothetical protein
MTMTTQYRPTWSVVVARAGAIGAATGAVIGALVGTLAFPIVITAVGAIAGAGIGLVVGGINGAGLITVLRRRASWRAASTACAVISLVVTTPIGLATNALALGRLALLPMILVPLVSAAAAGVLGPIAAFGGASLDGRPGQRRLVDLTRRTIVVGLVIGAAGGAVTGLIVGLFAWAPTAVFAAVEGGLLGCASGAVCALLVLFALICGRSTLR